MLVQRHGPMVQSVCRTLLGDAHDAEDAFQATFLVLARRGGAIREREALASWLYGVACRVAARSRAAAGRRRSLERQAAIQRAHSGRDVQEPTNSLPEFFEEVDRLPGRYRAPIVLCYLEGHSHEQAAETIGCPLRTLQTRLLRAKARLRTRLVRRGLAPAVGLLAMETLATECRHGQSGLALPLELIESTTREAIAFAAGRGTDCHHDGPALRRRFAGSGSAQLP